jgi:hypothetical protein
VPIRLRSSLRPALLVFLVVWVGWGLVGLLSVRIQDPSFTVGVPGINAVPLTGGFHNFVDSGFRADAYWYVRIATGGYSSHDQSAAFFPGYPIFIHLVDAIPGIEPRASAALVAWGFLFGSLVVMHALTRREFGDEVARLSVKYLAIFPTAFFFLADLSESTFLFFALLTFWFARADRWPQALIPAAIAGATRSAGVALFPALLLEAWLQNRADGVRWHPRLVATVGPLIGLGAYLGAWAAEGHWRAPIDVQKSWERTLAFPLTTLWHGFTFAKDNGSYWLMDFGVVMIVVIALLLAVREIPASYLLYALVSLLLPLSEPYPSRPLLSLPRFVIVIFPTAWAVALLVKRRWLNDSLVVGIFAGGFALLGGIFANAYSLF